jgi:hypothetical protein
MQIDTTTQNKKRRTKIPILDETECNQMRDGAWKYLEHITQKND